MGQTLNGSLDLSSTNGFTPGSCDQTNGGFPASLPGIAASQLADWQKQMALRGYPPNVQYSDIKTSLGAPERNIPTNVIQLPGQGVSPINAGKPLATTKNPDGSTASANGQISGTAVVFNNPA